MPESKYSQPDTAEEKSSESRKRKRVTTIQTDSDVLGMEIILDEKEAPPEIVFEKSSNLVTSTGVEEPAPVKETNTENPLYDSLLQPLSQKHLYDIETAFVVHKLWKGEVSGESLIYFLKGGRTMNINKRQLLSFKLQQELEYLVHIMHNRSIVHRRWISNMKTRIRQVTGLPTGAKEHFKPKFFCDKDGKEKEMPHQSVKIHCDQLGRYFEYTESQVGIKSITLDDIDDYDYTPSELRAAYWQITAADDESVKVKRILKKALEKAELKLLDKYLQKHPLLREIPDGYELVH